MTDRDEEFHALTRLTSSDWALLIFAFLGIALCVAALVIHFVRSL